MRQVYGVYYGVLCHTGFKFLKKRQVAADMEILYATMSETPPPPSGVEVFWEGEKGGGGFRLN